MVLQKYDTSQSLSNCSLIGPHNKLHKTSTFDAKQKPSPVMGSGFTVSDHFGVTRYAVFLRAWFPR